MRKKYYWITGIAMITLIAISFYFYETLFANNTCNSCIEKFKERCIICRNINWTNNLDYILPYDTASCMTHCNPINMPFPKTTTCDYIKSFCGIYDIK